MIAQTIASTIANLLAKSGSSKDTGSIVDALNRLTQGLQGAKTQGAAPSTVQDAIAALAAALAGDAKDQASGASTQGASGFIGRLSSLLTQLGGASRKKPGATSPTTGDDGSRTAKTKDTGLGLDAISAGVAALNQSQNQPAAGTQTPASGAPQSDSGGRTAGEQAAGLSASTTAAASDASDALGLSSASASQSAVGTRTAAIGSDGARNASPTVKTNAQPVNAAGESTLLLRTLERALNASTASAGDGPSSSSVFGALRSALQNLDPSQNSTPPAATQPDASSSTLAAISNALAPTVAGGTATAAAAKVATPLVSDDVHNIVNQIVTGVVYRGSDANQSVRISLSPPHLGDITVTVSVGSDRSISATVSTSSSEVGSTVLANSDALSKAFTDAGVKLAHLGVDVSGQGLANNNGSNPDDRSGRPGTRRFAGGGDDESAVDGVEDGSPGPTLLDPANLQLLNQLV